MSNSTVVIYHDSCADGFCAAWLIHKYFCEQWENTDADYGTKDAPYKNVEFIPWQYGNQFDVSRLKDKIVYIADFSFPIPVMEEILKTCLYLYWFDHHETAYPVFKHFCLVETDKLLSRFCLTKSGAMLVYEYLQNNCTSEYQSYRPLVEYVQDRDLWRFELPDSAAINNALMLEGYSFVAYSYFAANLHSDAAFRDYVTIGTTVDRVKQYQIKNALSNRRQIQIGEYKVEACNCPVSMLISELGNQLAKLSESGIGCVYFQTQNGDWIYSLRGIGKVKVNDLAKLYGGGGHPNAAGFRSSTLMV